MRLIEYPRNLDADACQGIDCEEAAVVQFSVRAAPAHQFIVLPRMNLLRAVSSTEAALGQRETVIVVVQFAVHHSELPKVVIAAEHGDTDLSAAEVPVDVERFRVLGRATL